MQVLPTGPPLDPHSQDPPSLHLLGDLRSGACLDGELQVAVTSACSKAIGIRIGE